MSEHRGRVGTEPSHKRVRIAFGGELIVDTDDALDVWEIHYYPQYYVPLGDVADGVLQPSTTRSPSRGTADHYTVRTSHRDAPDAAWRYPDSRSKRCASGFASTGEQWTPGSRRTRRSSCTRATHRRGCRSCSRHVTIAVDGVAVADPTRPTLLYETHLPRRTYIPKLDVRVDLLVPTSSGSMCPYKGTARYWSLVTPAGEHTRHRVELPGPAPRVGNDRRLDGVLRQPGRRHRGRQAPSAP